MELIITSFKISRDIQKIPSLKSIPFYSVARWQPSGFKYDELSFLAACDVNGNGLSFQDSSLYQYKHSLFEYYVSRWTEVLEWMESLSETIGIVCWCPYSNSIKMSGSFVCHTGLIGRMINQYRPDIDLLLDNDHHTKLINEFKPYNYKLLGI